MNRLTIENGKRKKKEEKVRGKAEEEVTGRKQRLNRYFPDGWKLFR